MPKNINTLLCCILLCSAAFVGDVVGDEKDVSKPPVSEEKGAPEAVVAKKDLPEPAVQGAVQAKPETAPASTTVISKAISPQTTKKSPEGFAAELPASAKNVSNLVHGSTGDLGTIARQIARSHRGVFMDSLEDSFAEAYKTSPEIKERRSALRGVDETVTQALAGWRPTIEGNARARINRENNYGDTGKINYLNGTNTPKHRTDEALEAGVQLNQNIYRGGGTLYQTREADANIRAARAQLMGVEQDVLFSVSEVYLQLLAKYAELELLKKNETNLRKTLEVTKEKFGVGEETKTSLAQSEGQLADAEARVKTSESEIEGLRASFKRITNREPGNLTKPKLPMSIPSSLEEILERVRLNFPQIIQAQYDEKSARHAIDRIESGLLPRVDLLATTTAARIHHHDRYFSRDNLDQNGQPLGYYPKKSNDRPINHGLSLQVTVPLYDAGTIRSQTRQQTEQAEQRRIDIERVRRQAMAETTQQWNNFKTAQANIAYYKKQVEANQVSLEGTQEELIVGSKILLDVLNAITRLVESQLRLVQAERMYYQSAFRLMFFMGEMTAKSLKLKVERYDPEKHYRESRKRL